MANFGVFSGPRARLRVGGDIIGYTGGCSGGEQIDYEAVETIDFLEVREHVPVAYRVTLSTTFFRVVGESLKSPARKSMFPTLDNILTSGVLSVTIEDRSSPNVPMQFIGCRIASKNFDLSPRGIVSDACDWVAIRLIDEFEAPPGG